MMVWITRRCPINQEASTAIGAARMTRMWRSSKSIRLQASTWELRIRRHRGRLVPIQMPLSKPIAVISQIRPPIIRTRRVVSSRDPNRLGQTSLIRTIQMGVWAIRIRRLSVGRPLDGVKMSKTWHSISPTNSSSSISVGVRRWIS